MWSILKNRLKSQGSLFLLIFSYKEQRGERGKHRLPCIIHKIPKVEENRLRIEFLNFNLLIDRFKVTVFGLMTKDLSTDFLASRIIFPFIMNAIKTFEKPFWIPFSKEKSKVLFGVEIFYKDERTVLLLERGVLL